MMVQAAKINVEDLEAVSNMLAALDPFVKLRQTMPLRCVQAFLLVAYNEGQPVAEYARIAKISATTMSRNLLDIGERDRYNEPGLDLVLGRDNPNNRREKEYFLSAKGRAMIGAVAKRWRG